MIELMNTPQYQKDMTDKIPEYYIGKTHKYEARKVVEDFELSYNLATACSYILRCQRKHDTPIDDIRKAINHLHFELDRLHDGSV
mgnify:CR=1 FL=1